MVGQQHFSIVGTGSYLPQHSVTAAEIDVRAQLPAGWTQSHLGVHTRYECRPPESLISMGAMAIERALVDAERDWSDIDLVIDCSTSRYRPIPCNAAHYQHWFGAAAEGIACLDLQSTCLGFIIALHTANALLASGGYRHIVIVASEAGLAGINWGQPESAGLIGDGAAAAVVARREEPTPGYLMEHETYAEHLEVCKVDGGSHYLPPHEYSEENRHRYAFQMDGPAVYRIAFKRLPRLVKKILADHHAQTDSTGEARPLQVLPHQASPKALELMRDKLGFAPNQFQIDMAEFGNVVAAGVPMMLDRCRRDGRIARGDRLMLLGTSAGYSQAAMIFEL